MVDGLGSLDRSRHRDLAGRERHLPYRRVVLCLVAVLPVLGLLNVFGQHPEAARTAGPAASLAVVSPTRLRGGLMAQARFTITAHRALRAPALVLDRGWFEQMTINSLEPDPKSQQARGDQVVLSFDPLRAGQRLVVYLQSQVNPVNVGRRSQDVELDDGATPIARLDRALTVFP